MHGDGRAIEDCVRERFAAPQRGLGLPPLRDVADHTDVAHRCPVIVAQEAEAEVGVEDRAVGAPESRVETYRRAAGVRGDTRARFGKIRLLGVQHSRRLADERRRVLVTERLLEGGIGHQDAAVGAGHDDRVAYAVEEIAKLPLRFTQALLHGMPGGHILDDARVARAPFGSIRAET